MIAITVIVQNNTDVPAATRSLLPGRNAHAPVPKQEKNTKEAGTADPTDGKQQGAPDRPNDNRPPAAASAAAPASGRAGVAAGEYGFGEGEGGTDMDRTIFRTLEMLSKVGWPGGVKTS